MARPWLDDAAYHALFGMYRADPANGTFVEELLGVRGTTPFECVGTPDETLAALHLARRAGRTIPHGVMTAFNRRVASGFPDLDAITTAALTVSPDHELSAGRIAQLHDYLDRH
jgi:hypothetical protein